MDRATVPIMGPETVAAISSIVNDHADRADSLERSARLFQSPVRVLHCLSEASAHRFAERVIRDAMLAARGEAGNG